MYKQGTVVLIPFPFTDLTGSKVRPAIVLSHKSTGADIVVAFISSKKVKKCRHPDVVLKATPTNGLKCDSIVKCSKIATLDTKIILGELGNLTQREYIPITTALKKVFGLIN